MTAAAAAMPTEVTGAELALLALSNRREVSLETKFPICTDHQGILFVGPLLGHPC